MKGARLFIPAFLAFLLLGSAALVRADSIPVDPLMDVTDPPCEFECGTPVGSIFSFSTANGFGFFRFHNVSGENWSSLLILTDSNPFNVPADTVTCTSNVFLCEVFDFDPPNEITGNGTAAMNSLTAMYFSIGEDLGGIPNLDMFTINLNGSESWGGPRRFDVYANVPNPVPEPSTLTLLALGIGTFLAKRRVRQNLGS
jgi:hypothetical protein